MKKSYGEPDARRASRVEMEPLRRRPYGRLRARQAVDAIGEIEVACWRCKALNKFG